MDNGGSQGGSCTDNCPVYLRLFIAFCALIAFAATAHEPDGFSDFCKGEIGVAIGNENTTMTGMSCSVSWSAFNFLIVNGVFIWLWLFVWLAGRHVQAVRDRLPENWPFVTLLVDANWCLWSMAGACAAASDLNKSICTVPENLNTTLSVQAAEDVGEICATSLYHVCSVKVGGKELHPHDFGCSSISSQLGAGACPAASTIAAHSVNNEQAFRAAAHTEWSPRCECAPSRGGRVARLWMHGGYARLTRCYNARIIQEVGLRRARPRRRSSILR